MHIQSPKQKQWVQERIEEIKNKTNFTVEGKKAIFNRLVESELFEQYLDKKFLGTKRYGIEGGESMIPGIEQIVKQSCLAGVENIFFGTAHRGRLTLLTTILGMSYRGILSKFQGNPNDPNDRGDTKIYRWRVCNSCKSKAKVPAATVKLYKKPETLVCPICEEKVDKSMIRLDHDHVKDYVRGFICNDCNVGMGLLQLDYRPDMLERVKNWIETEDLEL